MNLFLCVNGLSNIIGCSAIKQLADAEIVEYDSATTTVSPRPEAHHMTRHMIKFNTMVLLMRLPLNCDLKVVSELNDIKWYISYY